MEKTLYKKSSEGKLEQWGISVYMSSCGYGVTTLKYGELDGKLIEKVSTKKEGKNIGKSNETTPYEQALLEAKSKYLKQIKKGYVESANLAMAGKTDSVIEGAIAPMLATPMNKIKKITFPKFIQPKLNGHRCTAVKRNGVVSLWSRARRPINTMPHVLEEVSEMLRACPDGTFLDGELYRHGWTLQRITSAIKKTSEDTPEIAFHIYDMSIDNGSPAAIYEKRLAFLVELDYFFSSRHHSTFVATGIVNNEFEVMTCHDKFVSEGFEGAILRDGEGVYEYDHRSKDLIKVKAFLDDEFEIRDVIAGKDKSVVFVVYLPAINDTCEVTMSGNKDENQKYLTDHTTWKGKMLTVRYKELTPDGKLFHSTGLNIREDI